MTETNQQPTGPDESVTADVPPEWVRERVAQTFHEVYEHLAPTFGWSTQEASRTAWDGVPEHQRALMVAVVTDLIETDVIASMLAYCPECSCLPSDHEAFCYLCGAGIERPSLSGGHVSP